MTPNIKIIRLQSGEDIIADYLADEEGDTVLLDKPMHIILKRLPNGKSVMMMMPWLPVEIIKDNEAIVYQSDILRDRKSTRLNSSHSQQSRMPSSA